MSNIRSFKRSFPLFIVIVLIAQMALFASAHAQSETAEQFVQRQVDTGFAILSGERTEVRSKLFKAYLQRVFHLPMIGRFVAGRYWAQATETEQRAYLDTFHHFIAGLYETRLAAFSDSELKVVNIAQRDRDVFVKTVVTNGQGGLKAPLVWRIRNFKRGWRVLDVTVSGISMTLTQRDEFTAILQKNSGRLSALTSLLEKQSRQNIKVVQAAPTY